MTASPTEADPHDAYARPARLRTPAEVYAELGHTLLAEGRRLEAASDRQRAQRQVAAAIEAFQASAAERPDVPELHAYLADAFAADERSKDAVEHYLAAARASPKLAVDLLVRVEALLERAQSTDALRAAATFEPNWERAVSPDDPARLGALRLSGYAASLLGDRDQAIRRWEAVLAVDDRDSTTRRRLGAALRQARQLEPARTHLELAVSIADAAGDPDLRVAARLELARTLLDLAAPHEARATLLEAVGLSAARAREIEIVLARCDLATGDADEALRIADELVADQSISDPIRLEALVTRAQALNAQRRFDEAEKAATAALRMSPTHARATLARAEAILDRGQDPQQAAHLLRLYLQRRPGDPHGYRLLTSALVAADAPPAEVAGALEALVGVEEQSRRSAVLLHLAETRIRAGAPAAALDTLAEVAEGRDSARWLMASAAAKAHLDDLAGARADYERALEAGAAPDLMREYAAGLTAHGHHADAAAVLEKVAALAPGDAGAQLELARALLAAGAAEDAESAIAATLELSVDEDVVVEAHELGAEALARGGGPRREQAAALFEAGRVRYGQSDRDADALRLFARARDRDPEYAAPCWYLADIEMRDSFRPEPPFVDKAPLERALDTWHAGDRLEPPGASFVWAFGTKAWIEHQAARVSDSASLHWWRAIVALERSLAVDAGSHSEASRRWLLLASSYRYVECPLNGLYALDQVSDPNDAVALDERAALLTNLGRWEEAHDAVERRREIQRTAWIDAVEATVFLQQKRFAEACELLERAQAEEEDLWYHSQLAAALRGAGRMDAARQEYETVWAARSDPALRAYANSIAIAGYNLALLDGTERDPRFSEAATILEEYSDAAGVRLYEVAEMVHARGVALIAAGSVSTGARLAEGAIEVSPHEYALADFKDDHERLQERGRGWRYGAQAFDAAERLLERIERRREEIARAPLSPVSELERALAPEEPSSAAALGARAGLARLRGDDGDWVAAADGYRQVRDAGGPAFPEAGLAIARAAMQLGARGDAAAKDGDRDAARRSYGDALAIAREADPATEAAIYTRMSVALLGTDDDAALEHARLAAAAFARAGEPEPAREIGRVASQLVDNIPAYWAVEDGWRALPPKPEITAARDALRAFLERRLDLSGSDADGYWPVVTPVALELATDLVAEDPSSEWSLFKTYIPAMRDAIDRRLGMVLPGVRVRENAALPSGGYAIVLDDVTVARGAVPVDLVWCPAPPMLLEAAGLPVEELLPAADLRSGAPGCWIPRERAAQAAAAGFDTEPEPLEMAIHALEAELGAYASVFLDLDAIVALLDSWDASMAEWHAEITTLKTDDAALVRLAGVLRALVDQGVPLTAPEHVLDVVADRSDSQAELVRAIRLRLRERLPGNGAAPPPSQLPPALDDALADRVRAAASDGSVEVPPELAHAVFEAVRQLGERPAVVTRHPEVRPLLRRLVRADFGNVPVLAAEELVEAAGAEPLARSRA